MSLGSKVQVRQGFTPSSLMRPGSNSRNRALLSSAGLPESASAYSAVCRQLPLYKWCRFRCGRCYMLAKMTAREAAIENDPYPPYSVGAVEFNEKSPAAQWVAAASIADGVDLISIRSAGDIFTLAQQI